MASAQQYTDRPHVVPANAVVRPVERSLVDGPPTKVVPDHGHGHGHGHGYGHNHGLGHGHGHIRSHGHARARTHGLAEVGRPEFHATRW